MKLSPDTRVNDLLNEYPFIKEFLIELDPHFKALDNLVLRKTLGRVATLSKVAMVGGVELNKLVAEIAGEIKKKTGQDIEIEDIQKPERITDPEQRIEALKKIIEDLHKGEDIKKLKQRFLSLIRDVAPSEIANMEQRLIDEGMPEAEVKRLCDVHVEVFKESLEDKVVPGLPAGHPVHTYMRENRAAEKIILKLQAIHDIGKEKDTLVSGLKELSKIDLHYTRKENQLFPVLEAHGISGPSKVMWALHDDIRKMISDAGEAAAAGTITPDVLKTLFGTLNDMIYKEEHILFQMALETLGENDWVTVRKGEEEIGFAWISPPEPWTPSEDSFQEKLPPEKIGSMTLDTGLLTIEQINLLLTHLPVDISFVDENDKVAYYSNTEDRIFPRSPGIIGRSVQNCHPSKSVDMVNSILDSFRDGTKSTAEFWIQLGGKFIHIRYFAVRDAQGTYKGCLEVSQDVAAIRGLEGEKRLLDWE
jgi:DUF438 domain-containing protein